MSSSAVGATIFFGVFGLWSLLGLKYYLKFKRKYRGDKTARLKTNSRKLIFETLENNFSYFRKLDDKEKELFARRLATFSKTKKWFGREGLSVTDEMMILVSASAVQLTFGLNFYLMPHFHTIKIYPDIYLNKFTRNKHKGEVNPRGEIVLSWKHFKKGYEISDDNINLGLHEMAHALDISALTKSSEYLQFLFERFRTNFKDEYRDFIEHKINFLRAYGRTNKKEFFAVLIETYFESPQELKTKLPELYYDMCFLLNQDILHNIHRDFIGSLETISSKCGEKKDLFAKIIKKTRFNPKTIILSFLGISIAYFLLFLNIGYNNMVGILVPGIFVFTVVAIKKYYFSDTLSLTKDTLVISNKSGKEICIDLFDIIITIYNQGELEIAYLKNSKYHKIKVHSSTWNDDIEDILMYLAKTQILVKVVVSGKRNSFKFMGPS